MDDGDDKLRRNIVVWSALVIAFWFVGGHFTGDASYGPLKFTSPSDLKAWMAIAIVTIYLGLRHRFSVTTKASEEKMREEFFIILDKVTKRRVLSDYMKMMRTGRLMAAYPSAEQIFEEWYRDSPDTFQSAPPTHFSLDLGRVDASTSIDLDHLSYFVSKGYLYRKDAFQRTFAGGVMVTTKFSSLDKIRLKLLSAAKLTIYSHASTEYLLPFALAAIALAICVCKLVALVL